MFVGAAAIAARGRGESFGSPSIPTDNLIVWIEGDDGITDKSGNTDPLTSTGITIISNDLNGHDVFEFASGSGYIQGDTLTVSDPDELYIVAVVESLRSDENMVYAHRDTISQWIQGLHDQGQSFSKFAIKSNTGSQNISTATDNGDWGKRVWDFSTTNQIITTPLGNNTATDNYGTESFSSSVYTIGGYDTGSGPIAYSYMRLALLVAYSVKPTAQEISDIDTYISNTYGV